MLIFDAYDQSKNVFIRAVVCKNISVINYTQCTVKLRPYFQKMYSITLVIKMNLFILTDLEFISGENLSLKKLLTVSYIPGKGNDTHLVFCFVKQKAGHF